MCMGYRESGKGPKHYRKAGFYPKYYGEAGKWCKSGTRAGTTESRSFYGTHFPCQQTSLLPCVIGDHRRVRGSTSDADSLSGLDDQCHISMPEGYLHIVPVEQPFRAASDFTPMMLNTNDPRAMLDALRAVVARVLSFPAG